MNLRILKKLSKRAAPLLHALGDDRSQFLAGDGDSYTDLIGFDRKHWRRSRSSQFTGWKGDIEHRTRRGDAVVHLSERYIYPWPGTPMVGALEGYMEPEWEECTAWDSLRRLVRDHYLEVVDIELDGEPDFDFISLRRLHSPADFLRAVPDMLADLEKDRAERDARQRSLWEGRAAPVQSIANAPAQEVTHGA